MNLTLSEIKELSIYGKVALVLIGTRPALAALSSEKEVYDCFVSAYGAISQWLTGQPIQSEVLYFQHIPTLEKYLYHFAKEDSRYHQFYACLKAVYYSISRVDGLRRFQANKVTSALPNEVAEFTDGAILEAFAFVTEGRADKADYSKKLHILQQLIFARLPASIGTKLPFLEEETLQTWQRVFPNLFIGL